jgi:hypothetical protein
VGLIPIIVDMTSVSRSPVFLAQSRLQVSGPVPVFATEQRQIAVWRIFDFPLWTADTRTLGVRRRYLLAGALRRGAEAHQSQLADSAIVSSASS